jgi:hypothetical protein
MAATYDWIFEIRDLIKEKTAVDAKDKVIKPMNSILFYKPSHRLNFPCPSIHDIRCVPGRRDRAPCGQPCGQRPRNQGARPSPAAPSLHIKPPTTRPAVLCGDDQAAMAHIWCTRRPPPSTQDGRVRLSPSTASSSSVLSVGCLQDDSAAINDIR